MKRAAVYARFSTDRQNIRSGEDQIALCRRYCEREQIEITETFEDRSISGASLMNRPQVQRLFERCRARRFDVVVVEAFDRLSRDMEDLAGLYKRLSFIGVEIRAVNDGVADTITIGMRGVVGQLQREDGVAKTRRGMASVVRDGRHAGGKAYGYAPVKGEPGRLVIVEHEAAVVRRIFEEFVSGDNSREIAFRLNKDRIVAPRGRNWNASTIHGLAERGTGILRNELYVGRMIWNRLRMVKDPDTGRRLSRPNPRAEWHIVEVPEWAYRPAGAF